MSQREQAAPPRPVSFDQAAAETSGISREEIDAATRFLFEEARLADESRYLEWEQLVDDDMVYWVPRGEGNFDPEKHISITYDNRRRLANRIRQLDTGRRLSQKPPSPMRRLLSNIEVTREPNGEYRLFCNFALFELQIQATNALQGWPGRTEYRLRNREGRGLVMFFKKVTLVNGAGPVPSIAFLL